VLADVKLIMLVCWRHAHYGIWRRLSRGHSCTCNTKICLGLRKLLFYFSLLQLILFTPFYVLLMKQSSKQYLCQINTAPVWCSFWLQSACFTLEFNWTANFLPHRWWCGYKPYTKSSLKYYSTSVIEKCIIICWKLGNKLPSVCYTLTKY
jgi:hypothetical protein